MIKIIFKLHCRKKYLTKIIKEALDSFHMKQKIKAIVLERNNKIDDINVDYSLLKSGKITISFGRKNRITKKSIFHELGHVWDVIENELDFSREKFSRRKQIIGGIIMNLSLDGRLEKMRLPHYSKTERLKFFNYTNKKFNLRLTKNDFLKLWGMKLNKRYVINMINKYK